MNSCAVGMNLTPLSRTTHQLCLRKSVSFSKCSPTSNANLVWGFEVYPVRSLQPSMLDPSFLYPVFHNKSHLTNSLVKK